MTAADQPSRTRLVLVHGSRLSATQWAPIRAPAAAQRSSVRPRSTSTGAPQVPGMRSRQPGMSPEKMAMAEAAMMAETAAMGDM